LFALPRAITPAITQVTGCSFGCGFNDANPVNVMVVLCALIPIIAGFPLHLKYPYSVSKVLAVTVTLAYTILSLRPCRSLWANTIQSVPLTVFIHILISVLNTVPIQVPAVDSIRTVLTCWPLLTLGSAFTPSNALLRVPALVTASNNSQHPVVLLNASSNQVFIIRVSCRHNTYTSNGCSDQCQDKDDYPYMSEFH
jgi:hypothetical protein